MVPPTNMFSDNNVSQCVAGRVSASIRTSTA